MRCVGEIDITRPRWSERPTALLPVILGNIKNCEPGGGMRRFEQGRQDASKKEQELLQRLRSLPDGERKAKETKRMIDRVRAFAGYREYPKYSMVSRYFVYKRVETVADPRRAPESIVAAIPPPAVLAVAHHQIDSRRKEHAADRPGDGQGRVASRRELAGERLPYGVSEVSRS